jgi:glycosyltransferase involved in cell wall biosynthesis
MKKTVTLIAHFPYTYRRSIYRKLAQNYELEILWRKKYDSFRQWYFDLKDLNYEYKFKSRFLPFVTYLLKSKSDIYLITGYSRLYELFVIFLLKLRKKKMVLWVGIHNRTFRKKIWLKDLMKTIVLKKFDSFVTYGSYATDYLVNIKGVSGEKVVTAINVGEVSGFRKHLFNTQKTREQQEKILLLTVGNLISRKGIEHLIRALDLLKEDNWELNILGKGPRKTSLERMIRDLKLTDKIKLAGYIPIQKVYKFYLKADIFILPTLDDPFSISSSEALASGLFSLISKYDNASRDLVKEGNNGFIIDPLDQRDFAEKIKLSLQLAKKGLDRREISRSISQFSELSYANQIIKALELCTP